MNRRHMLAGAAALPLAAALPAIPAAVAKVAADVPQIDRAAFANRLHQWALHCPELGDRIDAMLPRLDHVLSTSEGTGELLEAKALCKERLGRVVSLDWLICGEGAMFDDKPADDGLSPDEQRAALVRDFGELNAEERAGFLEMVRAMKRHDYAAARHWIGHVNRTAGIAIAQI